MNYKKNVTFYCIERHFKKLLTVIITGELTNSSWHLYRKCVCCFAEHLMILHLLRMRRNINRNVFNDRKNASATTSSSIHSGRPSNNDHEDLALRRRDELGELLQRRETDMSRLASRQLPATGKGCLPFE